MKIKLIVLGIIIVVIIFVSQFFFSPEPSLIEKVMPTPTMAVDVPVFSVITENLDTPWGIAFLPNNDMLVTERPGRVRLIEANGQLQYNPVVVLKQVRAVGEGGLLGITIHPNFDFSVYSYVYIYYTYSHDGYNVFNRVSRMTYRDNQLSDERVIVDRIPGAKNHNGGRIKFGPDGFLYITTGDAEKASLAQDTESLAGKILRVTDEGKKPIDNPFRNLVFSYGHRNPQGIAWDDRGNLWETEHGQNGLDELNLITMGGNYGWPILQGDENGDGMETARRNSGATTTWAPGGAAFWKWSIFFGGLKGEALYEAVIRNGEVIDFKEHFKGKFGRIRDVIADSSGMLYITTSNKDGRGNPEVADDRIIRVDPKEL